MRGKKRTGERGLLSLEACISVTIFIFLMLFMYSFFILFEARNIMAHALLATTDSMAKDAYESSNDVDRETVIGLLSSLYKTNIPNGSDFSDRRDWYTDATERTEKEKTQGSPGSSGGGFRDGSATELDVFRTRFIAYLGNGDAARAAKLVKRLKIRDGLEGLDFSKTEVKDGKLYGSVSYKIDYVFDVFSKDGLELEHTACSKIWGK